MDIGNSPVSQEEKKLALNNIKILKKQLLEPSKFRETDYKGKACFSYGYRKYGCMETWCTVLNLMSILPNTENIFNELIMETSKVKPYLDVEWIKEDFPGYDVDKVKVSIRELLVKIFAKDFEIPLDKKDIYMTKCHRQTSKGYKYSFHVIVSTHPTVVFENTNSASYLALRLRTMIKEIVSHRDEEKQEDVFFNESIIDTAVYGKTQRIRLPGQCKEGDLTPMTPEDPNTLALEYVITNLDRATVTLEVPEQRDTLYRKLKNVDKINEDKNPEYKQIIYEKVKSIHPSTDFDNVRIDGQGFLQFNYKDRDEQCFSSTDDKIVRHDKIGFFVFIRDNLICAGCHSGNCNEEYVENGEVKDKKIIKILGSLNTNKNLTFEKVDFDNEFEIDHLFIKECILNGSIGISNLFEKMYLHPKRIKWINDTSFGSSYFWDGKLWQQDDYSFIERLLVTTVVKLIRKFQNVLKKNNETPSIDIKQMLTVTDKIITKLNDGIGIKNIINFVKPLVRDTEFSKIKDIHPYLLSCKNGMVDLATGELRPSLPEDNITKSIETVYDPNADSSDFDLFVRQITSNEQGEDRELYDFFRWCVGYALQGSPKKKLFIILYGPHGFNGKSLVMNTIKEILEGYAVAMDSSVVLDNGSKKTAGAHSTELMQLENCRLGLLSDTKEDACIDDGRMKQLTGITDKISAREIFGKQKEFTPTFVPFISTNHPIQVNMTDQAMYERLLLFPFVLSFVDDPKETYQRRADNSLAERFKYNKEGILKWLVDASVYYHQNQEKQPPQVIREAKEKYNKQVNSYVDFIDSTLIVTEDTENTIKKTDIIESYKAYMFQNNIGNKCRPKIAEREFDKIFKFVIKQGKKYYTCIKFKEDEAVSEDELN